MHRDEHCHRKNWILFLWFMTQANRMIASKLGNQLQVTNQFDDLRYQKK